MLKKLKQRGQVLVFYAFMIPTLFMMIGTVADFGWWYFNQSRLQNAADAAVLAGASLIANNDPNSDGLSIRLIKDIPQGRNEVALDTDAKELSDIYVKTNFLDYNPQKNSELTVDKAVFKVGLKKYYVVELRDRVDHLFGIMENFGDMNVHATAIAEIGVKNTTPLTYLANAKVVVGNWEVQNYYRQHQEDYKRYSGNYLFDGKWNHYKSDASKADSIIYTIGNKYRTETISVKATTDKDGNNDEKGTSLGTPANGSSRISWKELQSINIDFAQDVSFSLNGKYIASSGLSAGKAYLIGDWDIGYSTMPEGASGFSSIYTKTVNDYGDKVTDNSKIYKKEMALRVHALINFDEAYPSEKVIEVRKVATVDGKDTFVDEEGELYYISDTPSNGYKITVKNQDKQNVTKDFLKNRQYIKDMLNDPDYTLWPAAKILEVQDTHGNFKEWHYVYDPLWTRIESEPMWSYLGENFKNPMVQLDSVRQLILSFNESNVGKGLDNKDNPEDEDGYPIPVSNVNHIVNINEDKFILRPVVVFYDGPETNSRNTFLSASEKIKITNARVSQPVIINLNADLNGIFYMPNSPVILNHNNYNFYGLILAQKYLSLKTLEDGDIEQRDGKYYLADSETEVYLDDDNEGLTMFVDAHGNVQTKPYTGEMNYGEYKTFNISELNDEFFGGSSGIEEESEYNLLIM